jgi:predicted RecA/RadA family phage recombinase
MATNYVQKGDVIKLPVPSGKTSGDHALVGNIPVVCLTDRDSDGNAECALVGVFDLPVTGADGLGNSAVAVGDIVYDDSGTLNIDDANGTEFGVALGAVSSGATATVSVRLKG